MGGLVGVSVPLAGVGALGATGEDGLDTALDGAFFFCASVVFDSLAPKANMASEMPAVHNRTPTKLRELTKPEFEEGFFFTVRFFV